MRNRRGTTAFALPSGENRSRSLTREQSRRIVSLFRFPEKCAFARETSLESFRTIEVIAGPAFAAIQVPTAASSVGVLNFQQIEILFPIRTFFIERRIAVADFDPLNTAVRELTSRLHVSLVFVARNRAAPESAVFNGSIKRLLFAVPDSGCYQITHGLSLRRRPSEEPEHHGFASHMSLHSSHDLRSSFLFV